MTANINLEPGQVFSSAVLIGDLGQVGGVAVVPTDSVPVMTTAVVAGVTTTVSAALEIQSTLGGLLLPRMTTAQRNTMTAAPNAIVNGMMIFNSDAVAGGVVQAYENGIWVTLSNAAGGTFLAANGSAAAPSFSFVTDPATGMYLSAANTLDFAANGKRQAEIIGTAAAVDYLTITGSAAGAPGVVLIGVAGTDAAIGLAYTTKGTGPHGFVTGGGDQVHILDTATAVNYMTLTGSAANLPVKMSAVGTSVDIGLQIITKANGDLSLKSSDGASTPAMEFYNGAGTFFTSLESVAVGANLGLALPSVKAAYDFTPLSALVDGTMNFYKEGVTYVRVSILRAGVIDMFNTAKQIIPAPGLSKMIIVHKAELRHAFATNAYANGGAIFLQYGLVAPSAGLAATGTVAATLLTAAANRNASAGAVAGTEVVSDAQAVNTAIGITNLTATFDQAGAAGNLVVDVWFSVIDIV